ncbi:fungal-specific transcription factor domain-containing protein [Aspergillus pseudoustus]|uniref:Fungal-specific transcription factor domain-containing protein n=1 Tax=Aspergillus pseudoustus TaxID=1810923 RepID=A0ABR4JWF4_9EURO
MSSDLITTAAIRGLRSRRVPDDKRKRAAQACDRCKSRKSKCVGLESGRCQRCSRDGRICKLTKESTPPTPARPPIPHLTDAATSLKSAEGVDSNAMKITWPKFLLQLREALALDSHTELKERDMMDMQTQFHQPMIPQPSEIHRIQKASRALPPKPVADFLISVCLTHAHDVFFYVDQAQFLANVDQLYTDPSSSLRLDSGFVCLTLSILALGSQWTELERPSSFPAHLRPNGGDPGRVFYEEARTLIPDLIDRTSLTSIQAPFILGIYSLPDRALGSAYAYMGLALRKAVALELHQQTDALALDHEKQIRCRLWWSVYSLERTTAIKLNRPRSIDPDVISTPLPTPLPSIDGMQKVDNIQQQIAYASLIKVIDRIAELGSRHSPGIDTLQQELEAWRSDLPANLKIENVGPKDVTYRAVFHLHLNYLYAWILLGKGSLLNTIQSHVRGQGTRAESSDTVFDDLARSCVKASKGILHLCETLSRNQLIFRFSFTDFQGCSIATIVAILAGIIERDPEYDSRVAFGLNHLRTMAMGNLPAEIGVRFVEDLQTIANEAYTKLGSTWPADGHDALFAEARQEARQTAGYGQWAQWVSSNPNSCSGQQRNFQFEAPPLAHANVPTFGDISRTSTSHQSIPSNGLTGLPQFSQNATYTTDRAIQLDTDPQMMWSHDDQFALMGFTGLDLLEFEAFPTQIGQFEPIGVSDDSVS